MRDTRPEAYEEALRRVNHVQVRTLGGARLGALDSGDCAVVLLERTSGVLAGVTAFETLAARFGVGEETLRAVVRHGRTAMTEDLAMRGLIPARSLRTRGVSGASTWKAEEATL